MDNSTFPCNGSNCTTSPPGIGETLPFNIILGCSFGGLLIIGLFCWITTCGSIYFQRKRQQTRSPPSGSFGYSPSGDEVFANNETLELQQYGHMKKRVYTPAEIKSIKRQTYIGAREVEKGDLVLLQKIGNGNFGPLFQAKAWGIPSEGQCRLVTAKLLAANATEEEEDCFRREIALTSSLTHPNVVGLLGVCTKDKPVCLLLDAGECINLLEHIRTLMANAMESPGLGRPATVGKTDIDTQWFKNPLALITEDEHDLLAYADQVCLGMAFLSETQYVHKDLATRNCIITPNSVVKVANFGISQQLYPEAYCDVGIYKNLPLRWMSPEAITHSNFTMENDIWAFGVLLWELFTYGEFPYTEMTNAEVKAHVSEDNRKLQKPEGCKDDVYELMCMCWEKRPISRPSFLDLHEKIYGLILDLEQSHNESL